MIIRLTLFLFIFGISSTKAGRDDSGSTEVDDGLEKNTLALKSMKKLLPGQDALEQIGVTFLDALIKAGQIEMAKEAFKTQLGVLKKVQPDQYKKYKGVPISRLAADAVFEQAKQSKNQPKTGNRLIDMLHENGIPIGSSLKGIQQAIKTQREIENSDPAEQVAKAVFEKFQKQILPGLIANMIAGKNPFQIPQRPELQQMSQNQQRMFKMQHEEALKQIQKDELKNIGKVQTNHNDRLRSLLSNEELAYKLTDPEVLLEPKKVIEDPHPQPGFVTPRPIPQRPRKMLTLLIGKNSDLLNHFEGEKEENDDEINSEKHSAEYYDDEETTTKPSEPFRRHQETKNLGSSSDEEYDYSSNSELSRILTLMEDEEMVERMKKPSVLTDSQRMGVGMPEKQTVIRPRMFGVKTADGKEVKPNKMDMKVKQVIEEREVPPLFFIPQGRHTRLRWTGATEKEIPGLGTRLILPSLDPTMPAINSAISTQGKVRDEYDSIFKIPNYWNPGDVFGIDTKTVQERLVGGDGSVDFPAMQAGMTFG
ncbi:hypothetical protein FO519_005088 [Halicephalobus sp. NKZ332]|nr:hypothetical protein FO519_005088 [Halicephalobus sp. NKZ332]